jgi:hypothetical protein
MGFTDKQVAWSPLIMCASCGTAFCMESHLHGCRLTDNLNFYCPNGHANVYHGGEVDRLKRELAEAKAQSLRAEQRIEQERRTREWAEKRARGANIAAGMAKAAAGRLRARVHAGVCPDCHRTFKQLAAHMKAKHGQ